MWKEIPGYEGLYEASDEGQIRTMAGKVTTSKRFPHRVWKQRVLKTTKRVRHTGGKSDMMVTLWKNGKPHKYLVSRLIASTYHENNLYSDLTVNHKDGNPLNNNACNLEWLSVGDNIKYGFENGQYSFCNSITIYNRFGEIKARSYAELDRKLGQYKGYTSRMIILNSPVLKSKSGVTYKVKLV